MTVGDSSILQSHRALCCCWNAGSKYNALPPRVSMSLPPFIQPRSNNTFLSEFLFPLTLLDESMMLSLTLSMSLLKPSNLINVNSTTHEWIQDSQDTRIMLWLSECRCHYCWNQPASLLLTPRHMNQGTVLANMKLKAMTHFYEKAVPTFVGPTHCSSRFAKNFTQGTNPKIFNHTAVTRGDEYLLCEKFFLR